MHLERPCLNSHTNTDITFLSVHTICVWSTHTGFLSILTVPVPGPQREDSCLSTQGTCAVQSCTDDSCSFLCSCMHYKTKENHNKPTLFFSFLLFQQRLLNLHQSLGTKLERLKKIQFFYCICAKIIPTKERNSLILYKIHGTPC